MPPVATRQRRTRVLDIRQGDQVLVLVGKDAGKRGVVQRVVSNPQGWKKSTARYGADWQRTSPHAGASVVIEGINVAKRHTKPRSSAGRTDRQPRIQQGGILDIPMPIDISNVMVICPSCSRPTRIRHIEAADGRSVRACAHCGEALTSVEKQRS
ncbi:MAG: 50S ribosomal protein L24 [Chloroflexota bacterium]